MFPQCNLKAFWRWALLVGTSSLLVSCANTLVLTKNYDDKDAKVLLVDYGYHSSLILSERQIDGYVYHEFAFGEWNWFAQDKTSWWRLPSALFRPTTATLGRGQYQDSESLQRHLGRFQIEVFTFRVEPARAKELLKKLNHKFEEEAEGKNVYFHPLYNLSFVPLSSPRYHAFYNCNHALIDWVEELGVDVKGLHLFSRWKIEEKRK